MLDLVRFEANVVEETVGAPRLVRFGAFEVDLRAGELRKDGAKLKLTGQPFQVLTILLEQPGEVVTREELQKRLWPDTFVDVDHNLNSAINKIREVLGDSAESPRFVETLPRKGYRFIGPINGTGQTGREEQPNAGNRRRTFPFLALATTVFVLIPVILVSLNIGDWRNRLFVPSPRVQALAVLPFENLSSAPNQEYVSEGMTDEMITELGKIGGPRVISRQSIMQFKGSKKPLQQIARELTVDALLEGTVERSGERVRINVHLVQADPERQLWAQEYDGDIRDVLALQAEIARSVSSEIRVKLTPEEQRGLISRPPVDPDAHSEYLQGLYYESKTAADLDAAVTHFKNSIQRDPTFAPAYAELAINYFWMAHPDVGGISVEEMLPLAKPAVAKALQLDPSLPQAHLALGLLATSDYNWAESEAQYRAALELNPNCAECHHQYGVLLEGLGRNKEAIAQVKQAIELDPLSDDNRNQLAMIAFTARQYDLAIAQFESLHGAAWSPPLALSYAEKKMFPEAIAALKDCEARHINGDVCLTTLSQIYGLSGRTKKAGKIIDQLKEPSRHHYVFPMIFVHAYLGAGDKEQALTWLERAYKEKDPWLFWLKVWPTYDPLRSEPRFQALMRKLNFTK
jgi:TolB-like protein/DNA-binding winged helix-turn-helix (wHTH) protein